MFRRTGGDRKSSPRLFLCLSSVLLICPSRRRSRSSCRGQTCTLSWIMSLPVFRPVSGQQVLVSWLRPLPLTWSNHRLVNWTRALVFSSLALTYRQRAVSTATAGRGTELKSSSLDTFLIPDQRFGRPRAGVEGRVLMLIDEAGILGRPSRAGLRVCPGCLTAASCFLFPEPAQPRSVFPADPPGKTVNAPSRQAARSLTPSVSP